MAVRLSFRHYCMPAKGVIPNADNDNDEKTIESTNLKFLGVEAVFV